MDAHIQKQRSMHMHNDNHVRTNTERSVLSNRDIYSTVCAYILTYTQILTLCRMYTLDSVEYNM